MTQRERVAISCSKILEVSIIEFGSKGFHAASTNDICDKSGFSKGLVFYHFKSKQELYYACVIHCIQEFDEYMQAHFHECLTPLEGIRTCCQLRKQFFLTRPYYHNIFCEVFYGMKNGKSEKEKELLAVYQKHSFDIIAKILDGVRLNPKLERELCIQCAVMIIEGIDALILRESSSTDNLDSLLEEQMQKYEHFLEILLYGILQQ